MAVGHGPRRVRRGESGSVLLDLIVALFICSVAVLLMLGGIALAGRAARNTRDRAFRLVVERNQEAAFRERWFERKKPGE